MRLLRFSGHLILGILFLFMLLVTIFPGLEDIVKDGYLRLGVLGGLLAFLAYFERRISNNEKVSKDFLFSTERIYGELFELKSGLIRLGPIYELFADAMPDSNRVKELKIFAQNTDKIFDAFYSNTREFSVEKLSLLIQYSALGQEKLEEWQNVSQERIKLLDHVWYVDRPSSYFVIFDNECMILGGYYPDESRSGTHYIKPFLIRDAKVIESYIELHESVMAYHRAKIHTSLAGTGRRDSAGVPSDPTSGGPR